MWWFLLGMSLAQGAPSGEEAALIALAGGRGAEAVRLLEREARTAAATASSADTGEDRWRLLCLLGRAQVLVGDLSSATRTLSSIPLTARCGRQAAFARADALRGLGQEGEAAALYAELGMAALEGGHMEVLSLLEERAEVALSMRPARVRQGLSFLELAIQEGVPLSRRLEVARRMGTLSLTHQVPASPQALQILRAGLLMGEGEASDRLLLSRLLSAPESWRLLSALPSSSGGEAGAAEVQRARAESSARLDRELGYVLWSELLTSSGDFLSERVRLARELLQHGRLGEAARLGPADLSAVSPADASALQWLRAHALWQKGALPEASAELQGYLRQYPAGMERSQVESLLSQVQLQEGRSALARGAAVAAVSAYDALVLRDPRSSEASQAAYESALAARQAGASLADFRDRLREIQARWPGTSAAWGAMVAEVRALVFDANDLEAARALAEDTALSSAQREAAQAELSRQEAVDIHLLSEGPVRPGAATVQLTTRNLTSVEVRIHRIDAEAFLRAGGGPDTLSSLDVAVIAPDQSFTHAVASYVPRRDLQTTLALPIRTPGLYAVTVAAPDREARVILSVGELTLVARAAGPDLAAGLLEGGAAARGGRLLVASEGVVTELRPDRSGLVRAVLPAGSPVLLAESPRGVAMMRLDRAGEAADAHAPLLLSAELDRPVYLPGDRVGMRLVARRGSAPVTGEWRLWVEAGSVRTAVQRVQADARGAVVAELSLPSVEGLGAFSLVGQAPGEDAPTRIASAVVHARQGRGPNLSAAVHGAEGVVRVHDEQGAPMAGVAVSWSTEGGPSGVSTTDAQGEVRVSVAEAGLAWALQAAVVDGRTPPVTAREAVFRPAPTLRLVQDRLRPGERGEAILEGVEGQVIPVRLRLSRAQVLPESAPAPADPWVPALEWVEVLPPTWSGLEPSDPRGVVEEAVVWEGLTTLTDATPLRQPLPVELTEGRYVLRAVSQDGRQTQSIAFAVAAEGVRLQGVAPAAVGAEVAATLEAAPALVTVEGSRILEAALLAPGQRLSAQVRASWGEQVTWAATTTEGEVHARTVSIVPSLAVTVRQEVLDDGRWRLLAEVRDGDGRPVVAQVALRLLDEALIRTGGRAPLLQRSVLTPPVPFGATVGGVAGGLRHGASAEALSAALLQESAREEARQRASRADQGRFADNNLAVMFEDETILGGEGLGGGGSASGIGGLGTYGRGAGSSGYGSGGGRLHAPQITGTRERVLWAVQETDRQGVARVELPRPSSGRRWRLEATALTADALGMGTLEIDDVRRLWVIPPVLQPAGPEATFTPLLAVVNGETAARTCTLEGATVTLPAQARTALPLAPLRAGEQRTVSLDCGPGEQHPIPVSAPLADTAGVWTVAVGPGGAAPVGWLALAEDPQAPRSALRTALEGRAALAALPAASGSEAEALRERVQTARSDLLWFASSLSEPASVIQVLRFYADAGELLGVSVSEREGLGLKIGRPLEATARLEAELARARADLSVDPSVVDALLRSAREGQLSPEAASTLALLLLELQRPEEARALVQGEGPQAILAWRALGETARADAAAARLRQTPPPPVGDPLRPAWIEAVRTAPGRSRGVLDLAGQRLDLAVGGVVRAAGRPLPALDPALAGALVWQGQAPAPGEGAGPLRLERLPVGLGGAPVAAPSTPARPEQRRLCGDPCVLRVGDALHVEGLVADVPGWLAPGGLAREGSVLTVTQPGTWTLEGVHVPATDRRHPSPSGLEIAPPVRLVVLPSEAPDSGIEVAPISQNAALQLAEQTLLARQAAQAQALLQDWPSLDDWKEAAPRVAAIRFQAAQAQGSPSDLVARFEDLRAVDPEARLTLPEVAAVARAFAADGRPGRAVDVWRAGLGAAFLSEAAVARQIEEMGSGALFGSLQVMRRLTERYPDLPTVEEARFLLPQRLAELADAGTLPPEMTALGVDAVDLRLTAAAWDREFLALYPGSTRHPESGYNLVQTLLHLEAYGQAAAWAARLAERHPRAPTLDGLLYMEGLAASELGEDARALARFERVASGDFYDAAGQVGPAPSRDIARFAAARLREARGDLAGAREGYTAVVGQVPAAEQALWALSRVLLEPSPRVILRPGDPVVLPVMAANVPEVDLRIYRVDLRTLFLRDGGLTDARDIAVAGVSPTWSGRRPLRASPHPQEVDLALPLSAPGAWLVQISGGGQESAALVLRSELMIHVDELGGMRRVSVQRGGRPAAGVDVRAILPGGHITALTTDLRGVAMVPSGAAVLAFADDHYAVVDHTPDQSYPPSPAPRMDFDEGDLIDGLQDRTRQQRDGNRLEYEQRYEKNVDVGVEASFL